MQLLSVQLLSMQLVSATYGSLCDATRCSKLVIADVDPSSLLLGHPKMSCPLVEHAADVMAGSAASESDTSSEPEQTDTTGMFDDVHTDHLSMFRP